jgi:type VI protein secretion system component VasF
MIARDRLKRVSMDENLLARQLEEIRDLLRQQLDAYRQVLNNQEQALRMQREGMGRARKLLPMLGIVIVVVLVIVLVLLRYILQHFA